MTTILVPTNGKDKGAAENTALAPTKRQFDAPAVFGSRDEIAAVADRMRVMLPSARLQDWQLAEKYRAAAERNLEESLYRAAQLCVFYRLVPGQDVHLIPFQNGWAVDTGIESWKRAADRYCARHGISYHLHAVAMPEDELRQRRGDLYDPEDAGAIVYLWRSDKAQVYQIFGAEEAMTKGYGVWAKKGKLDKLTNSRKPDTIPAQRSKEDVARRRAMKMALKIEFSLDSLLAANPSEEHEGLQILERRIHDAEMDRALPTARHYVVEDDGDILFAEPDPQPVRKQPTQAVDAATGEITGESTEMEFDPEFDPASAVEDDFDNPFEDGPDYRAIADTLTGNPAKLVEWAKNQHANSDGPASLPQYRLLSGTLDKLLDSKGSHNDLLGVLIGRAVSSANPPGESLVGALLDRLLKETPVMQEGRKVKVENPKYRQDVADVVVEIWQAVEA